ncbi:multiple epidermal growth factor-like domains protein 10 [Argopecten irradians]|uniref:multiple epidermal growth factor-like domains protein 10 n=1 Tax=Argopecten irradians TaxID=31199 RepID=UPI00371AC0CE
MAKEVLRECCAVGGSASQSSDYYNWGADRAVDNCVTRTLDSHCCSHTSDTGSTTAWWRVDLGQLTTIINAITIFYRDLYPHRFAGYQLYVSNSTTSPQDGVLCFEDMSRTRDEVQMVVTHQCPYVGQYVTVYNYRNNPKRHGWYDNFAVLELCEVQVWGCTVGRYGDGNCASVCSGNCLGGNCNATTGDCFYCFPQTYGNKCDTNCSSNCLDELCEKSYGNCLDCVPQQYGIKCESECPLNCLDRLCENIDGICSDCVAQKYGVQCEQTCSMNCKDQLCDKDNGTCTGCEKGFYGTVCSVPCPSGCRECGQQTGYCNECAPVYMEMNCNMTCGQWGRCEMESGKRKIKQTQLDVTPIIGAVVGVICVVVIVFIIVIVIIRRRQKADNQEYFSDIGRPNVHSKNIYSEPEGTDSTQARPEEEGIRNRNTSGGAYYKVINQILLAQ